MNEVLAAVAAGTITPEEASTLIEALRAQPVPVDSSTVNEIYIKAGGARLIIIGDPTVAAASVDGHHRMEQQGGTLLITTNRAEGQFSTTPPRSAFRSWLDSWVERAGQTLTVRINPDLPLRVLNVGGSLDLTGVRGGASIGIEAGSARLDSCAGALNLDVSSGSAKVNWVFSGASTIKVDMGSAHIVALPGSDAVVTIDASLGQAVVRTADESYKTNGPDTAAPAVTAGAGAGTLAVTARMGSATVTVA